MPWVAFVARLRLRTSVVQAFASCALLWLTLAIGCGGARPAVVAETPAQQRHVDSTGLHVLSILRPTPNVVRVSLWIDAGSRDADPPQVAAVSAWAAAVAAGPNVQGRALPDAIELWIESGADDVGSSVQQLAQALATRTIASDTLERLRQQLVEQRARHELNSEQCAQRQALTAALGDDAAAGFFPFGTADDDRDVSAEHVSAFLADHFGPSRSLLVAVGDVHASSLSTAIGSQMSHLPSARRQRASRPLDVEAGPTRGVVDHAPQSAAAVAVVGTDRTQVTTLLTALGQRAAGLGNDARWLPVRGGAIGFAATIASDPLNAIRNALNSAHDANDSAMVRLAREDLGSLSEHAGLEFCAPDSEATSPITRVGVALTLADPVRGSPEDQRRAQAKAEATERDLLRVIERAESEPRMRGEVGAQAAHVVLDNGARIRVQRRDSQQVGIAISFLGGASEEHHSGHGRTALLALMSAQACEGLGAGALSARLQSLGATLSPVLESDSYGLRLSAPAAHWRASLDLIARCALRPLLNRRLLRDAQARMLASLRNDTPHGHAAQLATLLSPTHPGRVAVWGSRDSALLDLDVIARAHAQTAVGSRMALSIVGDVVVDDALKVAARVLGRQPAGALPQPPAPVGEVADVTSWVTENAAPVAVIAFQVTTPEPDPIGARVFAAMLAEVLPQSPTIQRTWLDAGSYPSGAWTALGLELPLEHLEPLNDTVAKAVHTLATPEGRTRARQLIERALQQQARQRSEPVHEAAWLADQALRGVQSEIDVDRGEHTFDRFVRSRPHYLVSRGSTARTSNNAAASRP